MQMEKPIKKTRFALALRFAAGEAWALLSLLFLLSW
jgi:hypothetical protein